MTEEKKEIAAESEPRPEEILSEILKAHESARDSLEAGGEEWLESLIASLPEKAREEIREYDKELAEAGVSAEKRGKFIEREAVRIEQTYVENRFTVGDGERILKEAYSKEKVVEWMKDLFDEKPRVEDLEKIARLSFDANGLKAVNDLSASHENGTEYLKRIADVLHDRNHPAREVMEKYGVTEVIPVTGGGDEYSIIVKGDKSITPEALQEITAAYIESIENLDVSDLVDFSDLETQLRYLGVSKKEFDSLDPEARGELTGKYKEEMPGGFSMRSSASGGAATLLEGFRAAIRDPREGKKLTGQEGYEHALYKMMGGLFDESDRVSDQNKTEYKRILADSESSGDRFYSKVLKRTTEARILEEKIETLTSETEHKKAQEAEMMQVLALDLDSDAKLKAIGQIMEKYGEAGG